jgi:hypothetical protein
MADKGISIGRMINVQEWLESRRESSCWRLDLCCSYFGVALASILPPPSIGFGSCRAELLRASAIDVACGLGVYLRRKLDTHVIAG